MFFLINDSENSENWRISETNMPNAKNSCSLGYREMRVEGGTGSVLAKVHLQLFLIIIITCPDCFFLQHLEQSMNLVFD